MAIDCWNYFDSETLYAACLQARATLDAAQMTAEAGERQALWTFGAGLLAAAGALIGGRWAYNGAVRQTKLGEEIHRARVAAYHFRMKMTVRELVDQATDHLVSAMEQVKDYEASAEKNTLKLLNRLYVIPSELRPEDWENHATLGPNAVEALHHVMNALTEAYRFGDEMRGKMAGVQSRNPTINKVVEESDGSVTLWSDPAVHQNVKVARELVDALTVLKDRL